MEAINTGFGAGWSVALYQHPILIRTKDILNYGYSPSAAAEDCRPPAPHLNVFLEESTPVRP